jgi:hypothetical protein
MDKKNVSDTINARVLLRVELKRVGGASPYSLAADLIPKRGAKAIQSDKVRELARSAFRGSRAR